MKFTYGVSMRLKGLRLSKTCWKEHHPGLYFWSPPWQHVPDSVLDGDFTVQELSGFKGQWAIVDLRHSEPRLIVDRQRSRQLLAAWSGDGWYVTDQIEELRGTIPFVEDISSSTLFLHFGHTIGSRTLIENVWDAEAGCILELSDTGETISRPYLAYRQRRSPVLTQEEYSDMFRGAIVSVVRRLLDSIGNRQIVVPISAGFDSRLILTTLKYLGAENVVSYSYGTEESPQAAVSERVAKSLGYPYYFVEYTVKEVAEAWNERGSRDYARSAWGATSLPFRQDWYAIRELRRAHVLQDGAVVLPGHSVPHSMALPHLIDRSPNVEEIGFAIAKRGGSHQGDPEAAFNHPRFQEALRVAVDQVRFGSDENDNLVLWQWMNLKDRQAKFISNSVRLYEHFGLSWALLLHEPEIWDARQSGGRALNADRAGYRKFVDDFYTEVSGTGQAELVIVSQNAPEGERNISWVRRATAALGRLLPIRVLRNWERSLRSYFRPPKSPFALEAFRPRRSLLRVFLDSKRGIKGNGLTAAQFLTEARGESLSLFEARGTDDTF